MKFKPWQLLAFNLIATFGMGYMLVRASMQGAGLSIGVIITILFLAWNINGLYLQLRDPVRRAWRKRLIKFQMAKVAAQLPSANDEEQKKKDLPS